MMPMSDADLIGMVAGLRRDLDEMKRRQIVGADNIRVKTSQSGNAYDYSGSVAFPSSLIFTVTFTADTQNFAPSELQTDIFVGSPSTPARIGLDYFPGSSWRVRQDASHPRVTTWKLQLFNLSGAPSTFYLKARVISTDSGVIS